MSVHGAHDRAGLQLVEPVPAPRRSRKHTEWTTSRPLLLYAPARLTRHSGQTRVTISHSHADAEWVEGACRNIAAFFRSLTTTAEQLTPIQRWCCELSQTLMNDLHGRHRQPPDLLPARG